MCDDLLTFGVTDLDRYPYCKYKMYCKQFIERCNLSIPCEKPIIETIDNIYVNAYISDFHIIKTILGYKLIVEGFIKYKVMYTAKTIGQSVHSAHFEHNFCDFILLDKICSNSSSPCINEIFLGIEEIVVNSYDCNTFDISVFLIMYPIIIENSKYNFSSCEDHDF